MQLRGRKARLLSFQGCFSAGPGEEGTVQQRSGFFLSCCSSFVFNTYNCFVFFSDSLCFDVFRTILAGTINLSVG